MSVHNIGKMMKKNIILLVYCFWGAPFFLSQIIAQAPQYTVKLEVFLDADNSSQVEQRLQSFLKRELRTLGDVKLVDSNELLCLRVSGMEVRSELNVVYGYALSVLSLYNAYCDNVTQRVLFGSTLFLSPKHGLKSTSEDIIAWFDQNSIEIFRNLED